MIGFGYPSYTTYKALERNATVSELVTRLTCWSLVSLVVLLCTYLLDPLLGFWLPLYYPVKLAIVAWLAFPTTGASELVLTKYVEPALHTYEDWLLGSTAAPVVQK